MMGEVSAGRRALEVAPLAPGTRHTSDQSQDPARRPTTPHAPLPDAFQNHQAETDFALDTDHFVKNLRCARRGAAGGVSGIVIAASGRQLFEPMSDFRSVGLRSATRTSTQTYWASSSDSLARRHPLVAAQWDGHPEMLFLGASAEARREFVGVMGFEQPSWQAASEEPGHPGNRRTSNQEPCVAGGSGMKLAPEWQGELFEQGPAHVKSSRQVAKIAGALALSFAPTNCAATLPSHLFRVILLRRLRQARPLCARWPMWPCSHARVLNWRGVALESILAKICREVRQRVRTKVIV